MIVADTNLIAHLLLEPPETSFSRAVWFRDSAWRLPSLWRSEFLSVLAKAMRTGSMRLDEANAWWQRAHWLFSLDEVTVSGEVVLDLAATRKISAYDAHFVAAAVKLNVPLVTFDHALLTACPDLALSPDAFLQP